ncbi:MAG: hypothetical protein J6S67_06245 [Methanobrevibacter sp.]|nr:hypothetical protein [Methanobrevibacter sp.]
MAYLKLHGHNYRVIRPTTLQAKRFYDAFCNSSDSRLDEVYGHYSQAKRNAIEYCYAREREFDAYDGVITGHNSCQFSYAFTGLCEGKRYLVYITKCGDYCVDLEAFIKHWEA